jgi:hypothetical protein
VDDAPDGSDSRVRHGGRIARVLAVLSNLRPGSPEFIAPVELKIDFCGTTAIRSSIARSRRVDRRANAPRSSVERSSGPRRPAAHRGAAFGISDRRQCQVPHHRQDTCQKTEWLQNSVAEITARQSATRAVAHSFDGSCRSACRHEDSPAQASGVTGWRANPRTARRAA